MTSTPVRASSHRGMLYLAEGVSPLSLQQNAWRILAELPIRSMPMGDRNRIASLLGGNQTQQQLGILLYDTYLNEAKLPDLGISDSDRGRLRMSLRSASLAERVRAINEIKQTERALARSA